MYRKTVYLLPIAVVVAWCGSAMAWTSVDVGTPAPGSAVVDEATGTWTLEGNGHDIWDNSDNFHFVYKYLVGDGSISARVVAWGDGSNAWAKAGVMMRETLAGESVHAMTVVTAGDGGGGGFQRRTGTAGASESNHDPSPNVGPGWYVRVERLGDEFRGYFSQDGQTWSQQGPVVTIPMRTTAGTQAGCYIGLCVTSHATGELRTATLDSVLLEGNIVDAPPPQLEAYNPVPLDGATGVITPLLQWTQGETAIWNKVYLATHRELTEADLVSPLHPVALYFHVPGLEPGATYYWRIDEVEPDGTTHTGTVWSFTAAPLAAFEPAPPPGANFQDPETDLAWTGGATAVTHDVYFSTSEAEVTAGAEAAFQGSQAQTMFDPGPLALETTYYWRIDEIDLAGTRHVGPVWSFTTTLPGMGGVKREIWENISGTALDALRADPRFPGLPTVQDELPEFDSPEYGDNYGGRLQAWLHVPVAGQYTFWVAGDDNTELYLGSGPDTAALICEVPSWTAARAWDTLASQTSEPIFLEADRYYLAALWKEGGGGDHAAAAWQGPGVPERTLIRGTYLRPFEAVWASGPSPQDGALDVTQRPTLRWSAGVRAVLHDVYLGDDEQAVADADPGTVGIYRGRKTLDVLTYEPEVLQWNKTYYWRIDEVNEAHHDSPWIGSVWSFTTADFLVVDDFEGYTDDIGSRIFQTWIDGFGFTEPAPGAEGNGTGSTVGHLDPPFAEQTIVYAGGQAMPMDYNNVISPWYSEADRTWPTPQDWTANGVQALTLHFRGHPVSFAETAPGRITMSAAGTDIWGTADEFRYAYKSLSGDGAIVVRVDRLRDTDVWAKAGLMIRQSLEPGATFAAVYLTGSNGVRFQARLIANDSATSDSPVATPEQVALLEPVWLRLERAGDAFSAFYSNDPDVEGWTPMAWNPQTVPMIGTVTIGLALTSHSSGNATVAEFSGVSMEGGVSGQWQVAEIGVDHPGNSPDALYVLVEDAAGTTGMVRHPDPEATLLETWQEWNIALSDFATAGVNLAAIKAMHIGVGDPIQPLPSGAGRIFIDEIRVYKPRCVPSMARPDNDLNGDCTVDYLDLQLMVEQWLDVGTMDTAPSADVTGDGHVTMSDFAHLAGTWLDKALWP